MSDIAISVKDVKIRYRYLQKMSLKSLLRFKKPKKVKYFEAVKGVSFEVEKGSILGIVGKNGSGKSTLLRAIAGIFCADEGVIDLHGNNVSLLSIGVGFNSALSGRENIYLSGMLLGFDKKQIDEKLEEIIEFSELGEFIDRPVRSYSSGMKARLGFAINVNARPDILIVDEALSVGDKAFQKKCKAKVAEIMADDNVTLLFVTHSLNTARDFCNRGIVLEKGKKLFEGDIEEAIEFYDSKQ